MRQKIELYLDEAGEFRWRLLSNKKVIAESGEGYKKKAKAKAGIQAAAKAFGRGDPYLHVDAMDIVDLTKPKKD